LGTSVLEFLKQEAAIRGATTLCADLSDEKPELLTFYKRNSFKYYPYRSYYKALG
jgi:hypothetical protein